MLIDPNGGTHCIDLPGGKQGSDKGLTLATCHGKDDDWHHQVWDKPKSDGRIKYSRSDGGGYFFYNKDNKLVIEGSSSSGDPNAVMKINNLS